MTDKPWSGFNTYLGDLRSRVDVNTDLPVLSLFLPHLVAHESYPGHHTEHTRKEVGLVRGRHWLEETIFLVGTPQCLLAEGLADLGLRAVMGPRHEPIVSEHLRPLGIRYDADLAAEVAEASVLLQAVRATAAWRLHQEGVDPDIVISELSTMGPSSAATRRQSRRVPASSDVAGLRHLLRGGLPALPQVRGRRPEPLRTLAQ